MINLTTKLKVFHNSTDYSKEAFDYTRDAFSLTLLSTDYLYVGFSKPINSIYVQINTANTNANTIQAEYYNGSTWVSVSDFFDDTKGFTRSGFMTWDRNQTNQASNAVNATAAYWIRFQPSASHSASVLAGINFIFADDNDLVLEVPEITDSNHLAGKSSHILTHVAVRNQIIQDLNNKDYKKHNISTGLPEDLTCWDILDVNQIRQAAVFLALSKIYFNFSDQADDKYEQKSKEYQARYKDAFQLSRLYLDKDDDGLEDVEEKVTVPLTVVRIRR
jgi:hypothetical protein